MDLLDEDHLLGELVAGDVARGMIDDPRRVLDGPGAELDHGHNLLAPALRRPTGDHHVSDAGESGNGCFNLLGEDFLSA